MYASGGGPKGLSPFAEKIHAPEIHTHVLLQSLHLHRNVLNQQCRRNSCPPHHPGSTSLHLAARSLGRKPSCTPTGPLPAAHGINGINVYTQRSSRNAEFMRHLEHRSRRLATLNTLGTRLTIAPRSLCQSGNGICTCLACNFCGILMQALGVSSLHLVSRPAVLAASSFGSTCLWVWKHARCRQNCLRFVVAESVVEVCKIPSASYNVKD